MSNPKCDRCNVSCPEEYMEECETCPQPLCLVCAEGSGMCHPCESADRLVYKHAA